jgi:hypothetical protein
VDFFYDEVLLASPTKTQAEGLPFIGCLKLLSSSKREVGGRQPVTTADTKKLFM